MRRELLYLEDILDACNLLDTFLQGMEASAFMSSELHKAAALQKLAVIGEAAARLPQEFRAKYHDVEWRDIIAFRNIAVHAYFSVKWDIVWATAQDDIPVLRTQVLKILQAEQIEDSKK